MKSFDSVLMGAVLALLTGNVMAQALTSNLDPSAPKAVTAPGEEVFKKNCAECHDPAQDRAPPRESLKLRWPDEIVAALTTGVMKVNGVDKGLSAAEIDAVATYLTGYAPIRALPTQVDPPKCESSPKFAMKGASWNGWSPDASNHRFQPKPGLKLEDIPRLQVKWSFSYLGGRYGQPTIVGGRVFTSSSSGKIYSLDAKTGCMHWRFDSPAGVRTTVIVGKNKSAPSGYAAYFGNYNKVYFAVDAASGKQLWEQKIEDYRRNVLTGAPVLYKDELLIAPVSAWEESGTAVGSYECCRARGSVVAMNTRTGAIVWKTYMLPEAQPWKKNSVGTQMWGPAGASIWSAPTIDVKRKLVYVATGDAFVEVKEDTSDSILALDIKTGAVKWKRQMGEGDAYLAGCPKKKTPKSPPNCPEVNGPDFDFGSSMILLKGVKGAKSKDVLVAGQKSSDVHGLNPDTGEVIWTTKLGKGSALGGIQWGMATDGKVVYAANADISGGKPGIHAVDAKDGKVLWYTAAPKVKCAWQAANATAGTVCINGNSQAPTAIPGAIIAGTIDGHLRGYDAKDGKIVWDVDTAAARYDTVNGLKQMPGGSLDAGGATVVDGMVFVMSGYTGVLGGVLENVLVAYSVDGK